MADPHDEELQMLREYYSKLMRNLGIPKFIFESTPNTERNTFMDLFFGTDRHNEQRKVTKEDGS
jgi:hypothetical protein